MKHGLYGIFLLIISIANALAQSPDLSSIVKAEQERHTRWQSHRSTSSTAQADNYDVKHYRLDLQIDPNLRYISGSVTVRFQWTNTPLNELQFDLSNSLQVNSVSYHQNPSNFTHQNNVLTLLLPNNNNIGQFDSVQIDYEGIPPQTGFGSFIQSYHGEQAVIWTLSEPYGASDWWVCKNSLSDKADSVDIVVQTPAAYTAASNGLLVDQTNSDNTTTYHWQHRYPIATYLIAVAVTDYVIFPQNIPSYDGGTLLVQNFVYPEDLTAAQNNLPNIVPMMRLYDSLTIAYPFANEKYGHAQFGWGGGMEHQTMTFVSDFNFELIAHELAHQWFGDQITCGTWSDIWLNEGFATYFSGLCYENIAGVQQYWEIWKRQTLNNIVSQTDGSVYVADTANVNRLFSGRLTYAKGAYLLHMLRWQLGDEDFFTGLRNYLQDPDLSYGFATTNHLKQHLEQVSGQNLTTFFQQWYYGEGYPTYHLNWQYDPNAGGVQISVLQTQSHPSVAFFQMPIPITLWSNGVAQQHRLQHDFSGQSYFIPTNSPIDSLQFDPQKWLISAQNNIMTALADQPTAPNTRSKVYPNPSIDQLYIYLPLANETTPYTITLYHANGQYIAQYQSRQSIVPINTESLPAGMYYCHIWNKHTSEIQKINIAKSGQTH